MSKVLCIFNVTSSSTNLTTFTATNVWESSYRFFNGNPVANGPDYSNRWRIRISLCSGVRLWYNVFGRETYSRPSYSI